jgi:hypothetical protein
MGKRDETNMADSCREHVVESSTWHAAIRTIECSNNLAQILDKDGAVLLCFHH